MKKIISQSDTRNPTPLKRRSGFKPFSEIRSPKPQTHIVPLTETSIASVARFKAAAADGHSVIADLVNLRIVENPFRLVADALRQIFGAPFNTQTHFHSTILSTHLTPKLDIPDGQEGDSLRSCQWNGTQFNRIMSTFSKKNRKLIFKIQTAVIGPTVQLVFRCMDGELQQLRKDIMDCGAQVKPGTLDGDRIHTATVVLGYFNATVSLDSLEKAKIFLDAWMEANTSTALKLRQLSHEQYFDTSLNRSVAKGKWYRGFPS